MKKSLNLDYQNIDKWRFMSMISWEGKNNSDFLDCCYKLIELEDYDGFKDFMVKSLSSLIIVDFKDKKNIKLVKRAY